MDARKKTGGKIEVVPLDFKEWKAKQKEEEDRKRERAEAENLTHKMLLQYYVEQEEEKAAKEQEEQQREQEVLEQRLKKQKEHDELLDKYRDLVADMKELKENGLQTVTDVHVNGEDTLELIRHRKEREEDGTLKDMVVFSDEYGEIVDEQKKQQAIIEKEKYEQELVGATAKYEKAKQERDGNLERQEQVKNALKEQDIPDKATLEEELKTLKQQGKILEENSIKLEGEVNCTKRQIVYQENEIQLRIKSMEERKQRLEAEKKVSPWEADEEILLNLLADCVYAQDTWTMDMETKPGMRLFNVLKNNSRYLGSWIAGEKHTKELIERFVDKLPLEVMELDKKEVLDQILKVYDTARNMILDELKKQKRDFF